MLKAALSGLDATTKYELWVNMWGNEANSCRNVGAKFNPLQDPSEVPVPIWTGWSYALPPSSEVPVPIWTGWSYALPPSDYYGEIDPFTSDDSGMASLTQNYFLQNLEGPQTIIGRSISLVKKATAANQKDQTVGCCVIARDIYHPPDDAAAIAATPKRERATTLKRNTQPQF